MSTIEDTIEPINTRTNYMFRKTEDLRIITETHLQKPLGRFTDEDLFLFYGLTEDQDMRPHLHNDQERISENEVIRRFRRNFYIAYGFHYDDGVASPSLGFEPIDSEDAVIRFFNFYEDCDPMYRNQIVYDSSPQKPSHPSYEFRELFTEKIEKGHPAYVDFNMSIEDIDPRWNGIIYDAAQVRKYKENHLDEDYQRIYGGKWVEGYKNKPYQWADIVACSADYYPKVPNSEDGALRILSVDSAGGTQRMRALGGARPEGIGRGDDAGGALFRLGDGTPENPDVLEYIYIAADVRHEPMAFDLHQIIERTNPFMLALDPGGGGGALVDALMKKRLDINGEIVSVTPVIPYDYELDVDGARPILHYVSRGDIYVKGVYLAPTETGRAAFNNDSALVNMVHTVARTAFERKTVRVPRLHSAAEASKMLKSGEINSEEFTSIVATNEALRQLNEIEYEVDTRSGARKVNASGLYSYTSPKRKDLAYCIAYGIFFCNTVRKFNANYSKNTGAYVSFGGGRR